MEVLIIGAGPSGLTLANVLAGCGVTVAIVDAKPGPSTQSRANNVQSRTLELLERIDVTPQLLRRGIALTRLDINQHGRSLSQVPLRPSGDVDTHHPYLLALGQEHTEAALIDRLAAHGVTVQWGTRLHGLSDAGAVLQRPDGSEQTVRADWTIGADGASSTVRHALGLGFTGSTYPQTGMLADVRLKFATDAAPVTGSLSLHLTRGGMVGLLPFGQDRYRLFGVVPPELAPRDTGEAISHDAYTTVDSNDLQYWFDQYFGVNAVIEDTPWTSLFRIHSRVTERFRHRDIFLIGDAAHIHSPAGGQGMNLGIGDAFNLGWKLALVVRGMAPARLLDSYESERRLVVDKVMQGTDRVFALETTSGPTAAWLREHVLARMIGPLTKLSRVRDAMFGMLSQLWIDYSSSPIVDGHASQGIRPGARAGFGGPTEAGLHHALLTAEPDVAREITERFALPVWIGSTASAAAVTLIRPDGHVGYHGDLDGLDAYLRRHFTPR